MPLTHVIPIRKIPAHAANVFLGVLTTWLSNLGHCHFSLHVFIMVVFFFCCPTNAIAQNWSHAEYGGGNYGEDRLVDRVMVRSPQQYLRLFQQLDHLVETRGPRGLFYLNNWDEASTNHAAKALRKHCENKGYTRVKIIELPGNFQTVDLPDVDTASLRNPEPALFFNLLDRFQPRGQTVKQVLERLAASSRSGLEITTHLHYRIPELLELGLEVSLTRENVSGYLYPDGSPLEREGEGEPYTFHQYHLSQPASNTTNSNPDRSLSCRTLIDAVVAEKR